MSLFKKTTDNKPVRRYMSQFFMGRDWGYESTITNITVKKCRTSLIVIVETHLPGLLIGKRGGFIDALTAF